MSAAALPFSFCAVMSTITPCHVIGLGATLLDAQIRSGDSRPAARWNSMATRRATARDLGMLDTF
jgi:hypothetical protein